MTRTLRDMPSEPQEKLPDSRRRARYLVLPPRVRTRWIRLVPIRVLAGWRPFSKALFSGQSGITLTLHDSYLFLR